MDYTTVPVWLRIEGQIWPGQATTVTVIVANGFSCREQIGQTTGRQALHLAEVIQMAMQTQQS